MEEAIVEGTKVTAVEGAGAKVVEEARVLVVEGGNIAVVEEGTIEVEGVSDRVWGSRSPGINVERKREPESSCIPVVSRAPAPSEDAHEGSS